MRSIVQTAVGRLLRLPVRDLEWMLDRIERTGADAA
jgi:hypothetical protein